MRSIWVYLWLILIILLRVTSELKSTIFYIKLERGKFQFSKEKAPTLSHSTAMWGNELSGALEESEQRKTPVLREDCLILRTIYLPWLNRHAVPGNVSTRDKEE